MRKEALWIVLPTALAVVWIATMPSRSGAG
jgi:hypothetical protein